MKNLTKTLLLVITAATGIPSYGQGNATSPFAGESEVTSKLFNLNELEINYHFSADAGGSNQIVVDFYKLSHWVGKEDLSYVTAIAQKYYSKVEDSFKGATSGKRLDIHIPADNEPVSVRISEYPMQSSMLVFKGSMQSQLKVNVDTIRVIKTNRETLSQVQYTFLLKDIGQIKDLGKDQPVVKMVANKFDSVVNEYRNEWSRQDRWTHNLNIAYYPGLEGKRQLTVKTVKTDNLNGKFYRAFDLDVQIGASIFRNQLSPVIETGLSYKWRTRNSEYMFVRIATNTMMDVIWQDDVFKVYDIAFQSIEVGWIKSKMQSKIPLYRTAIGFSYAENHKDNRVINPKDDRFYDPTLANDIFKVYYSFSLSKTFTIRFDQYLGSRPFFGLTGLVRLY